MLGDFVGVFDSAHRIILFKRKDFGGVYNIFGNNIFFIVDSFFHLCVVNILPLLRN